MTKKITATTAKRALTFQKPKFSFMGLPVKALPAPVDLAIFGAPHGTPYKAIDNRAHQKAPDAFRNAVKHEAGWLGHWDWDFDGPLLPNPAFKAVDLGNLKTTPRGAAANRSLIENATRQILKMGAVPLLLGGDDSVPIPFLAAYSGAPPITVLQIDAHVEWRNERAGEKLGFSSTMRRASEMEHVWRIVQVGARGLSSSQGDDVDAARQWGSHIIPARQFAREGLPVILDHIEPQSDCVVCLDLDALDSSVMPAVAAPSPGGLGFQQISELLEAVTKKARIAGFAMVEFVPARDPQGTAAYTAARLAAQVVGHVARAKAAMP